VDLLYTPGNWLGGFKDKNDLDLSLGMMKWIHSGNGKEPWEDVTTEKRLNITNEAEMLVAAAENVKSSRLQGMLEMEKLRDNVMSLVRILFARGR
jgi:hypothetical protein